MQEMVRAVPLFWLDGSSRGEVFLSVFLLTVLTHGLTEGHDFGFTFGEWKAILVAPYCAIPRDYLSDTPLLRAMGFLVSQHGELGAIPPPPFLSVSPLESMQSGGAIPPPQKGYLSDTGAIPYENKANGCDTPLCDTISKGYCAIGGVSRTGPLRKQFHRFRFRFWFLEKRF